MERPAGVTLLSVLALIGAVILALGGLVMVLGGAMMTRMSGMSPQHPRLAAFAGLGGTVIGLMMLGVAAVYVVMGIGLWKLENWARILTMVFAGLGVLFFGLHLLTALIHFRILLLFWRAIFAALNVWIVVYLLQPHVKQAFRATGL
jgi:hypothetical protein